MTEKRYTYSELNNCQYSVDYTTFEEIYGEENIFYNRICEVSNKKQAQKVVDLLNEQESENKRLKDKMNNQAFELYRDGIVSFGKAVELADMGYKEFIVYCGNKGHGMELSL